MDMLIALTICSSILLATNIVMICMLYCLSSKRTKSVKYKKRYMEEVVNTASVISSQAKKLMALTNACEGDESFSEKTV